MQNGMKAGVAIVVAFLLTGFAGFLTAVSPETVERTTYEKVADLTPTVSATEVDSYDSYYPASNVTGWSGDAELPITNKASAYLYNSYVDTDVERGKIAIMSVNPTRSIGGMNILTWNVYSQDGQSRYVILAPNNDNQYLGKITDSLPAGIDSGYNTGLSFDVLEGRTYNGGINVNAESYEAGGLALFLSSLNHVISVDGETKDTTQADTRWCYMPISSFISGTIPDLISGESVINVKDGTTIHHSGSSMLFYFCTDMTWSCEGNSQLGSQYCHATVTANFYRMGGSSGTHYLTYVEDEDCWYPTKYKDGELTYEADRSYIGYPSDQVYLLARYISSSIDSSYFEIDAETRTYVYEYVDPLEFVSIGANDGAGMWSNALSETTYHNGLVSFLTETGTTVSTNDAFWKSTSGAVTQGSLSIYVPDTIPYDMVLVTLDFISQECYAQGISPLKGLEIEDTVNYAVNDYRYSLSIPILDSNPFIEGEENPQSSVDAPYTSVTSTPEYLNGQTIYVALGAEIEIGGSGITSCSVSGTNVGLTGKYGTVGESSTSVFGVFGKISSNGTATVTFSYEGGTYTVTLISVGEINYPSYVTSLSFSKDGGTCAFIKETWVQLDPMNLLWGNPSIYVSYWYPDSFTQSDSAIIPMNNTGLRILFNSFVAYGDSFTINGQDMTVKDGKVSFVYYKTTDGGTQSYDGTAKMKGLAVDMYGGHVYLVSTEEKNATYDLGTYNQTIVPVVINGSATTHTDREAYTVSAEGAWYWYANLYNIVVTEVTEMHVDLSQGINGWGMNLQVSALLFVGMLILSVAGVSYFVRDTDPLSLLDWIIIGITLMLVMGVASI